jgi:formate transporter
VRSLCVVYVSNLIGSVIVAAFLSASGNFDLSGGLLGAYTIKVAIGKTSIAPLKGIASGILCNILVCIAILMATAATDIAGKITAVFFPIMAFVTGGFEHCIANMFYIPAGIMAAANPTYVAKAQETYGITAQQLSRLNIGGLLNNLMFVTAGNMIGGMLLVGIPFYLVQKSVE